MSGGNASRTTPSLNKRRSLGSLLGLDGAIGRAVGEERGWTPLDEEVEGAPSGDQTQTSSSSMVACIRVVLLVVVLVGILLVCQETGLVDAIQDVLDDPNRAREWVKRLGVWSQPLFVALFCVGEIVHLPGVLFVALSTYIYGKWHGGLLSYFAAVISVTVSFVVTRTIGGKALAHVSWKPVQYALQMIDRRPVRAVFLIRSFTFLSPAVNQLLALTSVSFIDYVLGSALGLAIPIALATGVLDLLVNTDHSLPIEGVNATVIANATDPRGH